LKLVLAAVSLVARRYGTSTRATDISGNSDGACGDRPTSHPKSSSPASNRRSHARRGTL